MAFLPSAVSPSAFNIMVPNVSYWFCNIFSISDAYYMGYITHAMKMKHTATTRLRTKKFSKLAQADLTVTYKDFKSEVNLLFFEYLYKSIVNCSIGIIPSIIHVYHGNGEQWTIFFYSIQEQNLFVVGINESPISFEWLENTSTEINMVKCITLMIYRSK